MILASRVALAGLILANALPAKTTIYFGPKQPDGIKDENWIQTLPGKGWFVILRLYSLLEPFFTKAGKPSRSRKSAVERGLCYPCGHALSLAPLHSLLTLTPGRRS